MREKVLGRALTTGRRNGRKPAGMNLFKVLDFKEIFPLTLSASII
jgi:hypothetical protein